MFKVMILLRKKEDMGEEEFARYWLDSHAPIAKRMPGLRRYVINVIQKPPGRELEWHGVVELWFDSKESMKTAFTSPEGQAATQDNERFTSRISTLYTQEHEVAMI
jgi:uncharacterized protein (TIGR02118 family)